MAPQAVVELSELVQKALNFESSTGFEGMECHTGEEVTAVCLVHRGREILVPLTLALRLLFDYLARHRHIPQSAAQAVAGMRATCFYVNHGANVRTKTRQSCKKFDL